MAKNRALDHSKYQNWIDPNETIPYEKNAKKHGEKQIKQIATSIRKYGWQQDTVLTSDNVVVIGHGRRLAAIQLGCQMPYHRIDKAADDVTEEDIKALRIVDNLTNESPWDFELRDVELEEIDLGEFDFDAITGPETPSGDGLASDSSSFRYQEQYAVTVICSGEEEQQEVYERLTGEGYECKVVCV